MAELRQLSKTFKQYLIKQDQDSSSFGGNIRSIRTEQKTVHYDMTRLTDHMDVLSDELDVVKKKQKKQEVVTWVAVGLAILGILI